MLRRGVEYLPTICRAHSGLRFGTGLYFNQLVSRVKARDSGGVFGPDCFGVKCCDRHGASVRRLLERVLELDQRLNRRMAGDDSFYAQKK